MQKYKIKFFSTLLVIISFAIMEVSAAETDDNQYQYNYNEFSGHCDIYDPYESFNRKVFIFNGALDTFILRPIAKGYGRFTSSYVKNRVEAFVDNISEPLSTVNYAMQGKSENTFKSFWRFVINSTFGIAGLFDVASKAGLEQNPQTFGSTLAHYGVGIGPYIVLPIYGGMGARDVSDPLISSSLLNPLKYVLHRDFKLGVTAAGIVHSRFEVMPFTDYVTNNSPDSYIAIRNAILNRRETKTAYPEAFKCPAVN